MFLKPRRSLAGLRGRWNSRCRVFITTLVPRSIRSPPGSPFFSTLPLANHGLEWIHSPSALAHPLDDGTAVLLDRDFVKMEDTLGRDAKSWRRLMEPFARNWKTLAPEVLAPIHFLTRHPFLLARFGLAACLRQTRSQTFVFGMTARKLCSRDWRRTHS